VRWCGYESNKLKKEKEDIANTLINLEKELGRPILREDISLEKTGFSMIVLVRMFGGLNKAKEELGWEAKKGIKEMCEDSWNFIQKNK